MNEVLITYRSGLETVVLSVDSDDPFPLVDVCRLRIWPELATKEAETAWDRAHPRIPVREDL